MKENKLNTTKPEEKKQEFFEKQKSNYKRIDRGGLTFDDRKTTKMINIQSGICNLCNKERTRLKKPHKLRSVGIICANCYNKWAGSSKSEKLLLREKIKENLRQQIKRLHKKRKKHEKKPEKIQSYYAFRCSKCNILVRTSLESQFKEKVCSAHKKRYVKQK